jgi:hypothetical protein
VHEQNIGTVSYDTVGNLARADVYQPVWLATKEVCCLFDGDIHDALAS